MIKFEHVPVANHSKKMVSTFAQNNNENADINHIYFILDGLNYQYVNQSI